MARLHVASDKNSDKWLLNRCLDKSDKCRPQLQLSDLVNSCIGGKSRLLVSKQDVKNEMHYLYIPKIA